MKKLLPIFIILLLSAFFVSAGFWDWVTGKATDCPPTSLGYRYDSSTDQCTSVTVRGCLPSGYYVTMQECQSAHGSVSEPQESTTATTPQTGTDVPAINYPSVIPDNFHCFLQEFSDNPECSQFYTFDSFRGGSLACPKYYNPVCGTNGKFYPSACWAEQLGTDVGKTALATASSSDFRKIGFGRIANAPAIWAMSSLWGRCPETATITASGSRPLSAEISSMPSPLGIWMSVTTTSTGCLR